MESVDQAEWLAGPAGAAARALAAAGRARAPPRQGTWGTGGGPRGRAAADAAVGHAPAAATRMRHKLQCGDHL